MTTSASGSGSGSAADSGQTGGTEGSGEDADRGAVGSEADSDSDGPTADFDPDEPDVDESDLESDADESEVDSEGEESGLDPDAAESDEDPATLEDSVAPRYRDVLEDPVAPDDPVAPEDPDAREDPVADVNPVLYEDSAAGVSSGDIGSAADSAPSEDQRDGVQVDGSAEALSDAVSDAVFGALAEAGGPSASPRPAQQADVTHWAAQTPSGSAPTAAAVAGPGSWGEFVDAAIDGWSATSRAFINSLPVSASMKGALEASFVTIQRTFFNRAPDVVSVQLSGRESGPITGAVTAVDPDGDPVVYRLAGAPAEGTVLLADDGTYTYTPGDAFDGVDTFSVVVTDTGLHINLLDPFRARSTWVTPVIRQGGGVSFEFIYTDGAEYWTAERREALQRAADDLMLYLVVDTPVTLTYEITGQNAAGSGTLASAGSSLVSGAPGFWPTVVQEKLITGVDANGSAADGSIQWNFGYAWDLDDEIAYRQFDFTSVAMHELMHSLGFMTTVRQAGATSSSYRLEFEQFIVTADGTRVIDDNYQWIDDFDGNLTGGSGGLYFGGQNAVLAYGGPVPLYTPQVWAQGSSVNHLDDETFTGSNEMLMNAVTGTGLGTRGLSDVELAILRDLGYTVVPQAPSSISALFAIVVVGVRRRRKPLTEAW